MKYKNNKKAGTDIVVGCPFCKKPIVKNTDFGMECEDECDRKDWESKNGRPFIMNNEIDSFFNQFGGILGAHINSFNKPGEEEININELKEHFKKKQ